MARFPVIVGAFARRLERLVTVFQRIEQAAMPGIAWLEIDFEAETAVGIRPARLGLCRGNGNRAAEIGVAVTRA